MIKNIKHLFGCHDWQDLPKVGGAKARACTLCQQAEMYMADGSWCRAYGLEDQLKRKPDGWETVFDQNDKDRKTT